MPKSIEELKKIIQEKEEKKLVVEKPKEEAGIDLGAVDKIVSKMKEKYREEGLEFEEVGGKLKQLRGEISAERKIEVRRISDLLGMDNQLVRLGGQIFIQFQGLLTPLLDRLFALPMVEKLEHYLDSANMKIGKRQFLALALAAGFASGIIGAVASLIVIVGLGIALPVIILSPLVGFILFILGVFITLLIPQQKARSRGMLANKELPFALRHMATQLRSGIGLYRTLQAIASSDYGVLSEEVAKAITEIEEGTDTKIALRNLADRTESKGLRKALSHIIRALKTGGNLSKLMEDIAAEVSFDIHAEMKEFGEKMNFFGVIFIFIAIVMPVFVAVLGGLRSAPIGPGGKSFFAALPLDPVAVSLIYLLILPLLFLMMLFYIRAMTPKF